MNPAVISRRSTSARILFTGAVAALALGTALAGGVGAVAAPREARAAPAPGTITTVAGGVGGPGKATTVALQPCGVGFQHGSIYVADTTSVRHIGPTGWLTTPAGTGVSDPRSNGGPATEAGFATCATATDLAGNLVIADAGHHQIDVVAAKSGTFYGQAMTAGHSYVVAGTGKLGYAQSGVPANSAPLGRPGVTVDGVGNLVIPDSGAGRETPRWARVQVVAAKSGTFYGQAMTAGDIYTVAGGGPLIGAAANGHPATQAAIGRYVGQAAVDPHGNLLVAGAQANRVWLVAAATGTFYGKRMTAGDIYTIAAWAGSPQGVTTDAAGNAVITETFKNQVVVVAARNGTFYGQAMTAGHRYPIAGTGTAGFSGDGGPATAAELRWPGGVAVDPATGNVAVAESNNGAVRVVAGSSGTFYGQVMTKGNIYTVGGVPGDPRAMFSGDGGPATRAVLSVPFGVAVDQAGNLVIADAFNNRVLVTAGASGTFYGKAMTKGNIYTVAGNGMTGFSGDGGPATSATISGPIDVAVDSHGNLVIAEQGNDRIRVAAVATGTFYGKAMTKGHVYTVAGNGQLGSSGDGGPATSARLDLPRSVAVDADGNLVIADTLNNRIRVVADRTGTFYGQAMTKGDIYTVAGRGSALGDGGPATSARLNRPEGVGADSAGNLLVADAFHKRVRVVAARTGTFYGQAMTKGDIYTVAGNGKAGFSGDGGPATSARLDLPESVTVDADGNLVIADTYNNRTRVVAARTGTFYGQAMTKGDIYTVAGNGKAGFSGDGGPGTHAELSLPAGVAADGQGNLVVSEGIRIRLVTG